MYAEHLKNNTDVLIKSLETIVMGRKAVCIQNISGLGSQADQP